VAAEQGILPRAKAAALVAGTLGFLWEADQSSDPRATGYRGFFYHFLEMETGARTWDSELSTIDSAILFAGALAATQYFNGRSRNERIIRELGERLYLRAEWPWMLRDDLLVHGWRPERGFLRYSWGGYNEALFLYILALGSRTHPVSPRSYERWTETYQWKTIYGYEFLYSGPLFTHQLSHLWMDLRGVQDRYMRQKCIDYFENSRRATYVQRAYAMHNPRGFLGYDENTWGVTASSGPSPNYNVPLRRGKKIFHGYHARGVPYGFDDGTLSPWAVVASLPFTPEIVVAAMHHINEKYPQLTGRYGYESSFNPTYGGRSRAGWISQWHYAVDQGPVVIMVENYLTGLLWRLSRASPHIRRGFIRAGFSGGWLG
jgi:hypothetical protein